MFSIDKSLIKSIFIIAIPAILEMALNTMLGVADTIMVSKLVGTDALSASGYANQIIFTLTFIFASFNTGASAMIARYHGEKSKEKIDKIFNLNLYLNLFIGIIITIASLASYKYLFGIYDLSDEVRNLTHSYFLTILPGMIFMFATFSINASLRGIENTSTPMKITGIMNVINIVLNYVLITGVGPFPELGIVGAGIATTISRFLALSFYVYLLVNGKLGFKFTKISFRREKESFRTLMNLSVPGAIEQFFMQIAFVAAGVFIALLDTTSEASFRVLVSIESMSFMPAVGISIASATLVGKALGENNTKKALETGYITFIMGIVWGIFIGTIFIIFSKPILHLYSSDINMINASIFTMILAGFNQPLLNLMIVMGGALRGSGDTKSVMKLTTLRLWVVFVPFTYVFSILLKIGVAGLWYAEILSFVLFTPLVFIRFKSQKWSQIKL
jgi:putative MATE family efflux protein